MKADAGKWLGWREAAVVLSLLFLFAFSFTLSSPVNGYLQVHRDNVAEGLDEVFDQDSHFIIDSLVDDWHFLFNPQHHLLYHFLTEGIYKRGIRPFVPHGPETAFLFLKVFTVLTGAAFLLAMSRLLWEMGLPPRPRMLLLALSGISVTAWFNFAAFEAHSLGMAGIALYLLALMRMTAAGRCGTRDLLLLGASLAFLFLCRLDLVRFFAATGLLIFLPPFRENGLRFAAVLATAFVAAFLLYMPMVSLYFKVPATATPKVLFQRQDDAKLDNVVATARNLTAGNLANMALATGVSTVIMPTGPGKFREPLAGAASRPLFAAALLFYAAVLARMAWALRKDRRESGVLVAGILANWGAGLLLYTWFNPREPFIWLLEFLPLIIAMMGLWLRRGGTADLLLAGAATVLVFLNNIVYFYLPYRI